MAVISDSVESTKTEARKLAKSVEGGEVVCLYGLLGAGKSVFAASLIEFFLPGIRVLSPTYIIVRHYQTNNSKVKNIIHADFYRIDSNIEKDVVNISEYFFQPDFLVIIEWADKLGRFLPEKRIDVNIDIKSKDKRKIGIKRVNI